MLNLFEELVNIKSITGNEMQLGNFLISLLQKKGFIITKQKIDNKRFNVLALTEHNPGVLFCTHIDTVAPFFPFKKEEDIIFGRGVCDAKGCLISMLTAAERLIDEKILNFGLLFVVGEEYKSDGAKKAGKLPIRPKYIILGEPTGNRFVTAQKGCLVFRIMSYGRSAHSAFPDKGDSAVHNLIEILHELQNTNWPEDDISGKITLNIGAISGGAGANVIADYAEAEGVFRISNSLEKVKEKLCSLKNKKIKIEIISETEPQKMMALDGFGTISVSWGSDAPYLKKMGNVLLIGPGSIDSAHSDNENIAVKELIDGVEIYFEIAKILTKT